ncbi:TIGR00153 family protein [Methanosarcina sp. KYL-1]|uniref:TIGR00153 family protein n=1 Tax=Methanosarcina sp. KYL-1 TaxID=2602068 RepID=UPI002100B614|nr:TIGR00153 family protein [Methanosarcina sp. KYL-1]MCQ1535626.1 TIGR00153 family protein [Methanosarcina sp. KYL-1]
MAAKYERSVIQVFGRPPFLPLEEHAKKAVISAGMLKKTVRAYLDGDMEKVELMAAELGKIEEEADYIKQTIRSGLTSSVKLPVDPKLLLNFLSEQDIIINDARNAAYWMKLREYRELPPEIRGGFLELSEKTEETVKKYYTLIEKLYKLVTLSFSKKQIVEAFEIVPDIEKLEHDTDKIESRLHKQIFRNQETLRGAGVCHLTELVEKIGDLADRSVSSADALKTMVIRR